MIQHEYATDEPEAEMKVLFFVIPTLNNSTETWQLASQQHSPLKPFTIFASISFRHSS